MMNKKIWISPGQESSLDEAETPLWFWNAPLEKEELLRQLKMQSEIGVKATNPHARTENGAGYRGGYLDREWFDAMRVVLDYKKAHGEKMWLYDEIDWPAGTCNKTITKNEKYREQYVTITKVPVPANEPFRVQIRTFEGGGLSGRKADSDFSDVPFNVHIVDNVTGEAVCVSDFLSDEIFGPELEFQSEHDCTAYLTAIRVDPYDHGGDESVNYMDKNATKAFLDSTYEKYWDEMGSDFGTTITTVFNDETRMSHAMVWCDEFAEAFQARHGYDIRQELYRVIIPGDENGRIRVDYYDTVAYLYQTRYFGVIHDWCEKHHLKFFAHLLAEETPFGHVRYSGDYLRQNRYQDVCGADFLGKGIGSLNLKFTSAGAHSYGKKMTAVEIFAGCGWDLTFDEYTTMITFAFQQGIQTIINHGFFYSAEGERANDWPPSEFFQWKYWNRQSEGNDMIRRLQYAMTGGVNEMDVLVYMPTESLQFHCLPDQNFTHGFAKGAFLKDEKAVHIDQNMQLILNALLSKNLDFDLIHRDAVENFEVRDKKIVNTKSGQIFSCLVLPMCEVLPLSMARLAETFAENGGTVLAVDELANYGISEAEDEEVRSIMDRLAAAGRIRIIRAEHRDALCRAVSDAIPHPVRIVRGVDGTVNNHPAYPPYLIDPYMHTGERLNGVQFVRYREDGERRILLMNYNDRPEQIDLFVQCSNHPVVWDTLSGKIEEADVVERTEQGAVIRLTLPCSHGVVVTASL